MDAKSSKRTSPTSESSNQKKNTKSTMVKKITDSAISMTFDSGSDVGYKSGELSSRNIFLKSYSKDSIESKSEIRFDSGLGTDVFSPLPSQSDIDYLDDDTFQKKPEIKIQTSKKESRFLWQDIYSQDIDGDTILHLTIVEARSDVIFPLIRQAPHPDFLDIRNDLGQTPLHLATLMGKSNIVRRLVVAGAMLDLFDHNGNTALHIASKNGDLDCVQALIQPLASEEIIEADCSYDLYLGSRDLSHVVNMKNYDGQASIHLAAADGYRKVLEFLYDNGADINSREGKSGKTALHFAVENGNVELIRILVSKNANICEPNYAGQTPIYIASILFRKHRQKVRFEILEYLKKHTQERWESLSDFETSSGDEGDVPESSLSGSSSANSTQQ